MNCGYARTAIRELTPKKVGVHARQADNTKRASEFRLLFEEITFPANLFEKYVKGSGETNFDNYCQGILNCFSKKWRGVTRVEYETHF